jgi:hypothetical protein
VSLDHARAGLPEVTRVVSVPSGTALPNRFVDGRLKFAVPAFVIHSVIAIE